MDCKPFSKILGGGIGLGVADPNVGEGGGYWPFDDDGGPHNLVHAQGAQGHGGGDTFDADTLAWRTGEGEVAEEGVPTWS